MDRIGLIFLFVVLSSAQLEAFLHCEGECVPSAECRDVEDNDRIVRHLHLYQTDCPEGTICCYKDSRGVCISTESCQNRGGSCKESCEPDEAENNLFKPCGWGSCSCCVPGDSPAHHLSIERQKRQVEDCGNSTTPECEQQGGVCKSNCSDDEGFLKINCSSLLCKCCYSCNVSGICLEAGGTCVAGVDKCPSGIFAEGMCDGEGCICCFPDCERSTTPECKERRGVCKSNCSDDEGFLEDSCSSPLCKCCYSCNASDTCEEAGGTCVAGEDKCPTGIVAEGMCDGEGCICCLPDCKEFITETCEKYNGECKKSCSSEETSLSDGCDSPYCTCCYSCSTNNDCKKRGGKCVSDATMCGSLTPVKDICDGEGCYCCLEDCTMKKKCEEGKGKCKEECTKKEGEIPDACSANYDGASCKCCFSCETNSKCKNMKGKCVASEGECKKKGFTTFKGVCEGKNCLCCAPKK